MKTYKNLTLMRPKYILITSCKTNNNHRLKLNLFLHFLSFVWTFSSGLDDVIKWLRGGSLACIHEWQGFDSRLARQNNDETACRLTVIKPPAGVADLMVVWLATQHRKFFENWVSRREKEVKISIMRSVGI